MRRASAALLLAALASLPLAAQYGVTETGLKLRARFSGEAWTNFSNGAERTQAGRVGSGRPFEGLEIRHVRFPIRMQVKSASGWSAWVEPGVAAGVRGKPITGLKLKADGRAIRYRASFVGHGVGPWALDGEPVEAGGAPIEALDVEVLDAAPAGQGGFEYRVFFAGSGFTPWLPAGEAAEGKTPDSFATAIEVRGPGEIRSEVYLVPGGWQPTALPGEVAGDATGKRPIAALRLYGPVPLQYRLKVERVGWESWQDAALSSPSATARHIQAIQLDVKRAR